MSADNGIYLLKTRGPEFRVAECQAIESIYLPYDGIDAAQLLGHFEQAPVFTTEEEAWKYAQQLARDCDILEYGTLQLPELPHDWAHYMRLAGLDELAQLGQELQGEETEAAYWRSTYQPAGEGPGERIEGEALHVLPGSCEEAR